MALDEVSPPAPWLATVVKDELRRRRQPGARPIRRGRPMRLNLVAALLLVALVASTIAVILATHRTPEPPGPARTHASGPSKLCVVSGPPRALGPNPTRMFSATVGWASGGLRTTDGGVHWLDVSPAPIELLAPGGYAEFFLDPTHAWIAEAGGSSRACVDHVVTFMTTDGGLTWKSAATIPVKPSVPSDVVWYGGGGAHWLYFIDGQNGWLDVQIGPASIMAPLPTVGALYRTTDGGLHWKLVSKDPGSAALKPYGKGCHIGDGISFISASTGWMPFFCPSGAPPGLLVTHDGGLSWTLEALPLRTSQAPVVVDGKHAITRADSGDWLVTADAGATWGTGKVPPGASLVDFTSVEHGWVTVGTGDPVAPDWYLWRTDDGGQTWTVVGTSLPAPLYGSPVSLVFVDATDGLLAMENALAAPDFVLLRTADGGQTWTQLQPTITKESQ